MKFKAHFTPSFLHTMFYGVFLFYFVWASFYPANYNALFIYIMGVIGAILFLSDFYNSYAYRKINIEILEKEVRKYKGETGDLTFKITQNGWLPIIGAVMEINAGDYILFDGDKKTRAQTRTKTKLRFSVMPKNTVIVSAKYQAIERGVARIFGSRITYPNLLGFNDITLEQMSVSDTEVIVYPEVRLSKFKEFKLRNITGKYRKQNALYHDKMLKVGSRDYEVGDHLRDIHWKQTARSNTLRTNVYEQVTELEVLILINLRSDKSYISVEYIEEIYEKVAYIAFQLTRDNIPYQLLSNVRHIHLRNFANVPLGSGRNHYKHTLEFLSRLKSIDFTVPFEQLVYKVPSLNNIPSHVIFTGPTDKEIDQALASLKKQHIVVYQLDKFNIEEYEMRGGVK